MSKAVEASGFGFTNIKKNISYMKTDDEQETTSEKRRAREDVYGLKVA